MTNNNMSEEEGFIPTDLKTPEMKEAIDAEYREATQDPGTDKKTPRTEKEMDTAQADQDALAERNIATQKKRRAVSRANQAKVEHTREQVAASGAGGIGGYKRK